MASNGTNGTNGSTTPNRFLIWGGEGWVAGHLKTILEKQGKDVHTTTIRMQNREAVLAELERVQPTHVLNAAGCTGRPNVDWCEDHKEETMRSNVIGTLNLTDCCFLKGIHVTVFATGCIYEYNDSHPWGGPGFTETDKANFSGSFYSETKAHVEEVRCLVLSSSLSLLPSPHTHAFFPFLPLTRLLASRTMSLRGPSSLSTGQTLTLHLARYRS